MDFLKAIRAELKLARDIADAAEAAERDLSNEERAKVFSHVDAAKGLKKRMEDGTALRKEMTDLSEGIGMVHDDEPAARSGYADRSGGAKRAGSLGRSFVESAEYKSLLASVPDGRFGEKARVQSQPYGVKDLITGADTTSGAGTLVVPDRRGLLDPFYQRPLTVRQLVSPGTTGSDVIEYVRVLSVTNAAAPVAEATDPGVIGSGDPAITEAAGGLKPMSGMTLEKDVTHVKTIAHWLPATKRALSDAAQIRTLIDSFLLYGVEEQLEDQMVGGDGTGENLLGLANVSGIQTQVAPTTGEDTFTVTRRARRKVRIGGRAIPTAYVMNPVDWENVELLRNTQGTFYGAGPFAMSAPTLWGLPVVESEAVPAGTAWCGDWTKAVLYDREQASIQVTDSHADFFVRNLVAILAEMRAAFAVLRPAAFVKISL
jgi:HK97 family phage major capsid protein